MTEKTGIIAGVFAFLVFSLFCAWHHTTQSNTHHSVEAPTSATAEIPPTTVPLVPQTTVPATEVPTADSLSAATPQPVQPTISDIPPPPEQTNQVRLSQVSPPPGLRSKVVEFYADSDLLTPKGKETIDALLPILRSSPMTRIEIAGYTDNIGTKEYNLALSQRRADAVKNYFITQGMAEQSIVAQGYGSSLPIADNATAEGRQHNRRTEVIVHSPVEGN